MTLSTTALLKRLDKLEAKLKPPKHDPFEDLTDEEVYERLYETEKELCEADPEYVLSEQILLWFPKLRPYHKGEPVWLNNRNHRMQVFSNWLGLVYHREELLNHPDHERIKDIFGRGHYDGYPLPEEDIAFTMNTFNTLSLDDEQPWLERYLHEVGGSTAQMPFSKNLNE
jgi:hypothetical protein